MRIAYVGDPASEHVKRWLDEFRARGHECVLFAPAGCKGALTDYAPIGIHGRSGVMGFATRLLDLRRQLAEFKPQLVHAHYAVDYGTWAALCGVRPFVLTLWGSDIYLLAGHSRLTRAKARQALKSADLITADSEDLMRASLDWGAHEDRLRRVVFGVDLNAIRPAQSDGDTVLVLSTRRLHDLYGIQAIVDACAEVAEDDPRLRLVAVGRGPLLESLRTSPAALRLGDRVEFPGYLERCEIERLYGAADILVSVPSSDATAVSLLEGMAGGAAVVASDLPSNREWVDESVGNRIVPAGDVGAIASALREMAASPQLRARAGAANRRIVEERADWTSEMDRMESYYLELTGAT